jgi:hypothetical protein
MARWGNEGGERNAQAEWDEALLKGASLTRLSPPLYTAASAPVSDSCLCLRQLPPALSPKATTIATI